MRSFTPWIKICGLTRYEDARLAFILGAEALGFIFVRQSPRYVSPQKVREILDPLSNEFGVFHKSRSVGVFANASLNEIREAVFGSGVSVIQLHGSESLDECLRLRDAFPHQRWIKAFRLNAPCLDEEKIFAFQEKGFEILVDSLASGQVGDWEQAMRISREIPLILAGGLNSTNVHTAIQKVKPKGVDASSGFELSPGIKCPEQMQKFFQAVEEASA